MATNDVHRKTIDQLALVVERAGETFADRLEADAKLGEFGSGTIKEIDKRKLESLFSQIVYGHVLAEILATFAFAIHTQSKDDNVVTQIAPSFLSDCEAKFKEMIPETSTEKTVNLRQLASDALQVHDKKGDVVSALLLDIANIPQTKPLRASYDAVVLALLGE